MKNVSTLKLWAVCVVARNPELQQRLPRLTRLARILGAL